jgi:hypothetical protein
MPSLVNEIKQVTDMRTAKKAAFHAALAQGIGQRQAAHDVASPDLQRGVGTENEMHSSAFS